MSGFLSALNNTPQAGAKKNGCLESTTCRCRPILLALLRQVLIEFSKLFHATLGSKFVTKLSLEFSPHFKRVATLTFSIYGTFLIHSGQLGPGAAEPRGPGGQLTPTFSGAGSTYGCGPPTFVRISWCMDAADNTFKLSDQWICDRKCR